MIIANLWYGTPAAIKQADAFVSRLITTLSGTQSSEPAVDAFALPVVGHEKNRILLAVKGGIGFLAEGSKKARQMKEGKVDWLRNQFKAGAAGHAKALTEPALASSILSIAQSLEEWMPTATPEATATHCRRKRKR